jgi:hypothetical protein
MNKKLFNDKLMKQIIDKLPILIIIIVIAAYCFMNMNDFTGTSVMRGGGFRQFGGAARYPPGTPFLFQMRYLVLYTNIQAWSNNYWSFLKMKSLILGQSKLMLKAMRFQFYLAQKK